MAISFTEPAVTSQEADAYAEARAWANWTGDDTVKSAAIRRGQDYIASTYNARWVIEFENDDAPSEVKFAIIEAARRELNAPGSLSPDQERGGRIKRKREKVDGAVEEETEWMDGAPAETSFGIIEGLLAGLIAAKSTTLFGFVARA